MTVTLGRLICDQLGTKSECHFHDNRSKNKDKKESHKWQSLKLTVHPLPKILCLLHYISESPSPLNQPSKTENVVHPYTFQHIQQWFRFCWTQGPVVSSLASIFYPLHLDICNEWFSSRQYYLPIFVPLLLTCQVSVNNARSRSSYRQPM